MAARPIPQPTSFPSEGMPRWFPWLATMRVGRTLRRCASDAGVELHAVDNGTPTLRKTRVVGQHQQIVRLDYEDVQAPSPASEAAILELLDASVNGCDIVVISDYAKGFLSPSLAQAIIRRAHDAGRQVVVDPRPQNRDCYIGCDYSRPTGASRERCSGCLRPSRRKTPLAW